MKEQSQIQFYDKLLSHLNKTFVANLKTQELYLDLTRNTRQLRFKSIKNIYYTLTEGKADQIIYHKHKPIFTKSQIYDQSYTKRTCWRVIQKLITKIAYYLTYQRGLSQLAPTILRAVNYTRKATDKITNKASFMQFYSQVLDLLIEQNNILAKKIYALLIDRGYIYSIDQFYKLSRFEDDKDFVYQLGEGDKSQNGEEKVVPKVEDRDDEFKKTFMGKRRGFRGSLLQNFGTRFSQLAKQTIEIKEYEQQQKASEEYSSQSSQSAQSQQQQQLQKSKVNKLNHTIHTQIQKVIDQFVTHPNYQLFLASINEDQKKQCSSPKKHKQPVVKKIIKNIRIKNYKANEKILEMNQNTFAGNQSERKNSYQSMTESKKSKRSRSRLKKGNAGMNNRTSIATAVSKMVRENIFKKQGVQGVQELLISNLQKTFKHKQSERSQGEESRKILYQSKKQSQKKMRRQNSYNGDVKYGSQFMKNQLGRKVSSIEFFSNAFIFKRGEESKCYIKNKDKMSGHPHSLCGDEDFKSIQNIFNRKHQNKLRISQPTRRQFDEGQIFHNQKLSHLSKFYEQSQFKLNKKGRNPLARRQKQKFNTNMLQLAAKKYHKFLPQEQVVRQNNRIQKIDLSKVFVKKSEDENNQFSKMMECGSKKYLHKRKFEVFDRRNRKIL